MHYFIGTDEAGYGPNLGPLVVAGTLWRVDHRTLVQPFPWHETLAAAVSSAPSSDGRIAIADSKSLYASHGSLHHLERGVLAACGALERPVASCRDFQLASGARWNDALPWHPQGEIALPLVAKREDLRIATHLLRETFLQTGVSLVAMQARVIAPADFNAGCQQLGNKASLLSSTTLRLIRDLLPLVGPAPLAITCDRHGGRKNYASLVRQELLSEEVSLFALKTVEESPARSAYHWSANEHAREIEFVVKGDSSSLPTALASMLAKYLREICMMAWNQFWQLHLPHLKATAGYPVDAQRFRREILKLSEQLGYGPELWWRER